MRIGTFCLLATLATVSCRHTLPGTHVEVIDKGGEKVYHTGAASMAESRTLACGGAHKRAVAAIALRFAQDNGDLADDVAKAVGVSDGEVFLQKYAKYDARTVGGQDEEFDPIEHVCMVTVTWKAPVFVKEAILKFAQKMKEAELGGGATAQPAPPAPVGSVVPAAPVAPAGPSTPPPPPVAVAPAPAPSAPSCPRERSRLDATLKKSSKVLAELNECLRRTSNDETICHRYKLYVDEARGKEDAAGQSLADCLNARLSVTLRAALSRILPGHAAVSVETRGDGSVVLWAFSPASHTAFSLDVSPSGQPGDRTPLAANQVQWLRQQLGL